MKKRLISVAFLAIAAFSYLNVSACGEIKDFTSSAGTVKIIDDSNYLITVPAGTNEVTISAQTDYEWVPGFEPRSVSTKEGKVRLEVDGKSCGYGIYTYFVDFKELPNVITENDPIDEVPKNEPANKDDDKKDETPVKEDLKLDNLTIKDVDFVFDPTKRTYNVQVDNSVQKLDIAAIAAEDIAIDISDEVNNLKEGRNTVVITLKDPKGNEGVYTLNVDRLKLKSSNNYLSSLVIANHMINFNSSITTYNIEIKKETTLNITPVAESEFATVAILGNTNLIDGSKVTVRVTAEDGSTRDYTINIVKRTNLLEDYYMYFLMGGLVLLLIILFFIMRRRNKKRKQRAKVEEPSLIETQEATAGAIQIEASMNTAIKPKPELQAEPTMPSSLKIIEPSDIDTTVVNEDESPTEVFKL